MSSSTGLLGEIHPTGFTTLQDGGPKPTLDIVFVHGLNGRPDKSWTFFVDPRLETAETQKWSLKQATRKMFKSSSETATSSTTGSASRTEGPGNIFWPKDLLAEELWAKTARIMTYGYDADVFRMGEHVNFSTISAHGGSLLIALARVRVSCQTRPLMFIVHSLGGLVVKSALNKSVLREEQDLRAVVESTFAAIFFGTPHRGSNLAQFGETVARLASVLTAKPYNANIVGNLGPNNEILSNLRNDFQSLTLKTMRERNQFESSTFQEAKGYSSLPGFQGKVVQDDACEMGSYDRNDHINKNHIDMVKFFGSNDPEYIKVIGEVRRHMNRIEVQLDSKRKRDFCDSLRIAGDPALERARDGIIPARTDGTLQWIYSAKAKIKNEDTHSDEASLAASQPTLAKWLGSGSGIYWITGKPGSGKSTSMKHLLHEPQTQKFLECHDTESTNKSCDTGTNSFPSGLREKSDDRSESSGHSLTTWTIVGIFATNRGSEDQKQWRPLLLGAVHQLLTSTPKLIAGVMDLPRASRNEALTAKTGRLDELTDARRQLTTDNLEDILVHCKSQSKTICKVLILLDGLDELESEDDKEKCIKFLQHLCSPRNSQGNIFKACVSGRYENTLTRLLVNIPLIEIHEHTYYDIRRHVESRLGRIPQLHGSAEEHNVDQLLQITDYIAANARGVFLWVRSVCNLMVESLYHGQTLSAVYKHLKGLPKEVAELYTYTLKGIDPPLRWKAYIMLEAVSRTRTPLTLSELSMVVHVAERTIDKKSDPWCDGGMRNYPDPKQFLDPMRLRKELISSCKCILEITPWDSHHGEILDYVIDSDSAGNYHHSNHRPIGDRSEDFGLMQSAQYDPIDPTRTTVQLLHRSALDFLQQPGCLDVLLDGMLSPLGSAPMFRPLNGHAYILYFAKAWLQLPKNVKTQLRCNFNVIREVAHHAPFLEPTLPIDAQLLFTVLDDIDRELTLHEDKHERWPQVWYESLRNSGIASWNFTFPAFAAAKDMRGYMQHLVQIATRRNDKDHFLNQKEGRPLHFFAAFMPWETAKPDMLKYLLEQGADINARFDGKTIIESVVINRESRTSAEEFETIKLLLDHGADANSRYLHYPRLPPLSWPILHIVARFTHIELSRRLDLMVYLHSKGADLNAADGFGQTFVEVLYWHNIDIPAPDWKWLFRNGAKITKRMISTRYLELQELAPVTSQVINDVNQLDDNGGARHSDMRYQMSNGYYSYHRGPLKYPIAPWKWSSSAADQKDLDAAQSGLIEQRSEKFGLRGICDESSDHNAKGILFQEKFRKREWYTEDAAEAAETCRPGWFAKTQRPARRISVSMRNFLLLFFSFFVLLLSICAKYALTRNLEHMIGT